MGEIVYAYDGTLAGLLCCVFESYVTKENPQELLLQETATLFPVRTVITERQKAERVWAALRQHGDASEWVRIAWLSCAEQRAILLFRFIRAAFQYGASVCRRNADAIVAPVLKLVTATKHEAHLFCGFVRFADYEGVLAAQISPKAMVLSLLQDHFVDRFSIETFLIHDLTHGEALFHEKGRAVIRPIEGLELEQIGEEEQMYRRLWRKYYDSIAIEGRYNPKCRMTHMPKRYWGHLTEFQREDNIRSDKELPAVRE